MYGSSPPDYVVDCAKVLSGDAIVVEGLAGTRKTIHVRGIDAPEAGQPYGPAATRAAKRAVEGRRVEVEVTGETGSGALVGRVRAGRKRIGPLLACRGLAWHDHNRAPGATLLAALQREAQSSGRGLWAQDRPVPPGSTGDAPPTRAPPLQASPLRTPPLGSWSSPRSPPCAMSSPEGLGTTSRS